MNMHEQYNLLIQRAIDKNLAISQSEFGFLNAKSINYNVVTYSNVKIKFSLNDQAVEVVRLDNGNPVFCRYANGEVYRIHGEINKVKEALEALANN